MNLEQKTLTSMEVAEMVGKDHKELLRDIRRYSSQLNESKIALVDFFQTSTYQDSKNEERPCYLVTKKGCEFIGHKITGTKGAVFTAKYINRFHEMEEIIAKPISALDQIDKLFAQGIIEVNEKVDAVDKKVDNFIQDLPMLGVDCDIITNEVKRVGVNCLGGKKSNAYNDKSLRGKVYSDIHREVRRQFGVERYKEIKRSQIDKVIEIVDKYILPLALKEEINNANAQMNIA